MDKKNKIKNKKTGVLHTLKLLFERNRLGELLVLKGELTPKELKSALEFQKSSDTKQLGKILLQYNFVSKKALYTTLSQQITLRVLTTAATVVLTFASLGAKQARAGAIKDVPAQITLASTANSAFAPMTDYPSLFGTEERASSNLEPFTKWTGMFDRFDQALNSSHGQTVIRNWQKELVAYQGLPLLELTRRINDLVNEHNYIIDSKNWGKSDYWATPVEFFSRGGDCEDFAIAKYTALRALGVPEERLRIAIIHDEIKDMPHAVLIVYTDSGAVLLDNQIKDVRFTDSINRYRPIFTINRTAWWLHTKPKTTVLASAR